MCKLGCGQEANNRSKELVLALVTEFSCTSRPREIVAAAPNGMGLPSLNHETRSSGSSTRDSMPRQRSLAGWSRQRG